MSMVLVEQSQRPYRFGMTLLCVGALFNWLGVADSYSDPVPAIRYIGVGLIAAGAILICLAMCFWMKSVRPATVNIDSEAGMHVESLEGADLSLEKPPDYATVVDVPPCYEDAIKLNPAALLPMQNYNAFIEKSVSITKDEPARVNIDSAGEVPDPKKGSDKMDEAAQAQATASNNTLSRVLRKSIRGIRKQLTSSTTEGAAATNVSVADCAATSSRSYNVITVIPSKLPSLHKNNTALNSRPALEADESAKECMGDPPAYEETIASQNCQSCTTSIADTEAGSSSKDPSVGETVEPQNLGQNQSAPADVHSSSSNIDVKSLRVSGDCEEMDVVESFPDTHDIKPISNKVNDIITSAQSEAQRKSSLAYVDASRNR